MNLTISHLGNYHVDEFGHCNTVDFDFVGKNITRSDLLKFFQNMTIQAWVGHKTVSKYFQVLRGTAIVRMSSMEDVDKMLRDCELIGDYYDEDESSDDFVDAMVERCSKVEVASQILTHEQPKIVEIPAGVYYGFVNLTQDTIIQVFSDKSTGEELQDRFILPWDTLGRDVWINQLGGWE